MLQTPDLEYLKKVKTILSEHHKKKVLQVSFDYYDNGMYYTFEDGQELQNTKQNTPTNQIIINF